MAESTLSLTFDRLRREMGREKSYGHDPSLWTGDRAYMATDISDRMTNALALFYQAHDWKFLKVPLQLFLSTPYTTGTIAIVNGTVTLTGGVLPTWTADGDFIVDGEVYDVASRTSNTVAVLVDPTVNVDAGTEYQLIQSRATLPDDFASLVGELHYQPSQSSNAYRVRIVDDEQIRLARQINYAYIDRAVMASIRAKTTTGVLGQRFELSFWPSMGSAARLNGKYRINPNLITTDLQYPYGGMLHGPTILAACLAEVEQSIENNDGRHALRYQTLLPQSIRRDNEATAPQTVGFDLHTDPNECSDLDRPFRNFDPDDIQF